MGFWSWLFGPGASAKPPAWSTFADEDAFARFVETVRVVLAQRGHEVDALMLRSGSVVLRLGDRDREWILHLLAERCASAPEAQWARLLDAALDRFVRDAASEEDEPPAPTKNGKKRRKKGRAEDLELRTSPPLTPADLRVQLMSSDYLSIVDRSGLVSRACAPGIEQVLVALFGGMEITLGPADVERLGVSEEEAWQIASDMSLASDLDGIVTSDLVAEGGSTVTLLVSNGFFMGACVLRMLEKLEGEHALVTWLTWHHAVIHVLDPTPSLAALTLFTELVAKLDDEVAVTFAERLSPSVYCYRRSDRSFTPLVIERDEAGRITAVEPELGYFAAST